MNPPAVATIFFIALVCVTATTDHDKVQPFPQPEPTTVSEKAAILFKPQLITPPVVCVPFPAVNADGGISGGLKKTGFNGGCKHAPLGSQIYGRTGWYKDQWAIMYAWYFPKSFGASGFPSARHGWQSVVVWIDNPAAEKPNIVGVSMSTRDSKYIKTTNLRSGYFVDPIGGQLSDTSLRFEYTVGIEASLSMFFAKTDGQYQDLIMWEQLTDNARAALNDINNFGKGEVPFNDGNYENALSRACLY
ncbi:hypothetical protein PHMEG_00021377 [Phytophthora megakarya]|uniref:Necrosis inducing protein NPP1 n=1 Tax=Phytophthora megakarya TaxID=4795 RepID=A0A225VLZ8_9STRA|nr:hypothetical protein PHMEG_00021377 [Phytophthora megakarya]